MKVVVRTVQHESALEAVPKTSTREIFNLLCKSLGIQETWYFGLMYYGPDNEEIWVDQSKKAKYGDYSYEHNEDILTKHKLLPERVTKQHAMNMSDWHTNIINMWKKHNRLDKEEAMLEYLKLVQNLEMYGVTYFHIKNRKGTDVILGVTALGLNIYKEDDRLNPTIAFPWSEIKNLKFKDKKFMIRPSDKSAKDFIIFTQSGRMSKQKYYSEKTLRQEAEQREIEYKKQIQLMKEEMEKNQQNLLEAQKTIHKLQQQLEELQRSKEELELQKNELHVMMERLEQSKNLEAAERQKLEEEIRAKHEEVLRIQEEVERRDAEAKRLQEEQLEEASRREEEQRQKQLEEHELEALPEGADTSLPELKQVNEQLKEQLKSLQSKLETTRHQEEETNFDKIHRINLLEGRDKYKTLADIRRGNTVRRVELFENM
ncbi:hypothetical protein NQ314_012598 [Rhamnusium bicolor]|uniref:FERM domain-containing protein n=1 Tax=Rhamnusium bicolor TaxID=1586634 RepID=A0AAV8XB65_9CUCU|nr:hypothetical protein NQ314_012598 [Rhamnusium bicolor]